MRTLEDFARLAKEAFANSGCTVTVRTGETGHPTSEETQATPDTNTTGIEVVFVPRRGKPQER
jgi:hypothetical protein